MYSNRRTIEPSIEPVTAEELDTYLRGDGVLASTEGEFLETLITSAREYIEEQTRRALINQTWTMYLNAWPSTKSPLGWWDGVREGSVVQVHDTSSVELPIGPLVSVTSVKTYDQANVATTMDAAGYFLDTVSVPGSLNLNTGTTWPVFTRDKNGIEIVYVAGYGASADNVPMALRTAVKMLAAHWYENRELTKTQSDQNQAMSPVHVQSIINRYKVMKL